MKKFMLALMVVFVAMGVAGTACAGVYFSGNIAYVMVNDATITDPTNPGLSGAEISLDGGNGLILAVGSEFKGFRYEGELSYTQSDMERISKGAISESLVGDVNSISLLGNVIKDFETNKVFTPFVGLGIGVSQVEGEMVSWSGTPPITPDGGDDDTVFAYQVMLGCGFKVSEKMNVDVSYRYFATSDPTFNTVEVEISSHNILVGVRVGF